MAYRRKTSNDNACENLSHEHCSLSGFEWVLTMPNKKAAYLGQAKPKAMITCDGFDPIYIPVSVARAFEKALKDMELQEPDSHAEILYDIKQLSASQAFKKIADMVSRREYSSQEAIDKLKRDGFSSSCAEFAVARAQELKLINNKRFTDSFIRSKIAAGMGPQRIERELSQRGIDASAVEGWPEDYLGSEGVTEAARALINKKPIPSKNAYPKLVRYLVSRGYSLSCAKQVVSERLEEAEQE